MDGAAILAALTTAPAKQWGWADLGALAPGMAASFLVVDGDPLADPLVLAAPREVWIDGARR
jgi:imidazolonepropionase-like amidohydrolase